MFLKRIILKNFKSFYKTTVIDLPDQITAIVGPNGSGKSNIVDAIRWALGEQSFKNLRVEKSNDLIFSNKDNSAGFAEVELIFDNTRKIFPLDFSEVSILRRVNRNEESCYFLNHESCRLKDIIELISQAKIGLRGFSIINQGSVENILRVSPIERKIMLEESLGLKNLEIKKEEAKRKLEGSLINLDKAKAQLEEITPHLRFLKRQVKKYTERQEYEKELKTLLLEYFSYIYKEILSEKQPEKEIIEEIKQKIHLIEKEIALKEKELGLIKETPDDSLENQIKEITNRLLNKQNDKFNLLQQIKEKESKNTGVSLNIEELKRLLRKIESVLKEMLEANDIFIIKEKIKEILKEIQREEKIGKRTSIEDKNLKEKLNFLEQEINNERLKLVELQKKLEEKNKTFREKYLELEEIKRKRESLLNQLKKEELEKEKFKLKFEDYKRRLEEEGLNLNEIEKYLQENQLEENKDLSLIEKRIWRLKKEIMEAGSTDENVLKEYEEVNKRYEFLANQVDDLNKAISDLKNLINELNKQIEESFKKGINEINKEFLRYFRLIFKGGSVKLVIKKKEKVTENNEENVNEDFEKEIKTEGPIEGVDIKVDIPKTQIKSLEILSGGEKTLTAIALLFSIVNQSDPPLVVVDEIDAALDEENSRRFAEILKELSKNTQFIVVTHNRMTMMAASVIYGVTLKDNISQLISIKLEESEQILKN